MILVVNTMAVSCLHVKSRIYKWANAMLHMYLLADATHQHGHSSSQIVFKHHLKQDKHELADIKACSRCAKSRFGYMICCAFTTHFMYAEQIQHQKLHECTINFKQRFATDPDEPCYECCSAAGPGHPFAGKMWQLLLSSV